MLKRWNILIKLAFLIPSLLLLSKVCFPFVGPSLLPNTSCPKHWRTNGRSIPRPQAPPVGAAGSWSRAHPTNSPSAAQVQPTRRPLAACLGVGPLWPRGIGGVFLRLGRCSGTSHSQRAPGKPYIHSSLQLWGTNSPHGSIATSSPLDSTAQPGTRRCCGVQGGGGRKTHHSHANLARISSSAQGNGAEPTCRMGRSESAVGTGLCWNPRQKKTLGKAGETWAPCSLHRYHVKMLFLKQEGVFSYCYFRQCNIRSVTTVNQCVRYWNAITLSNFPSRLF